jgi:hypothetical protein
MLVLGGAGSELMLTSTPQQRAVQQRFEGFWGVEISHNTVHINSIKTFGKTEIRGVPNRYLDLIYAQSFL